MRKTEAASPPGRRGGWTRGRRARRSERRKAPAALSPTAPSVRWRGTAGGFPEAAGAFGSSVWKRTPPSSSAFLRVYYIIRYIADERGRG